MVGRDAAVGLERPGKTNGRQVILGSGSSRVYSKSKGNWALLLIRLLTLKSWEGLGLSVMQCVSDRIPSVKWEW